MNVLLIHGWLSHPGSHWYPWLKKELEANGWTVTIPEMPNAKKPEATEWIPVIKKELKRHDSKETIIIGHSLGCLSLLYALEKTEDVKYAKGIFVSGFGRKLPGLQVVSSGFEREPDWEVVQKKAKKWFCIHAEDDRLVPFKEGEWLAKKLNASWILKKTGGHLSSLEHVKELPELLTILEGDQN